MNIRKIAEENDDELIDVEVTVEMLALAGITGTAAYILDEQNLGALGVDCHKLVNEAMPGEGEIGSHHVDAQQPVLQPEKKKPQPVETSPARNIAPMKPVEMPKPKFAPNKPQQAAKPGLKYQT